MATIADAVRFFGYTINNQRSISKATPITASGLEHSATTLRISLFN